MHMPPFPYTRIAVVGSTSSGKSTLAEKIAARLDLAYVELDSLYWQPGWRPAEREDFRERVQSALDAAHGRWIVAGNYRMVRDVIWPAADMVIWLDYPFPLVFWRLLVRTIRRLALREELWNGNRERLWDHLRLWSRDSLFNWLFQSHWRLRREYPEFFAMPAYAHLHVLRFATPDEANSWFAGL
jgi:adenylate kinase family enzyme